MATLTPLRHLDNGGRGIFTYINLGEIVECPRCQHVGYSSHHRFLCQCCQLFVSNELRSQLTTHQTQRFSGGKVAFYQFASARKLNWFGNKVLFNGQSCEHCGSSLEQVVITADIDENHVSTICPICYCTNKTSLTIGLYHRFQGESYNFALPLFLQETCKFGVLWAYNAEHLADLKAFVQANLRERTPNAGNGSLFSRLPLWIKSAKNRAIILKMIEKLEAKHQKFSNIK